MTIPLYEDRNGMAGTLRPGQFAVATNAGLALERHAFDRDPAPDAGRTAALGAAVFLNLLTTLAAPATRPSS